MSSSSFPAPDTLTVPRKVLLKVLAELPEESLANPSDELRHILALVSQDSPSPSPSGSFLQPMPTVGPSQTGSLFLRGNLRSQTDLNTASNIQDSSNEPSPLPFRNLAALQSGGSPSQSQLPSPIGRSASLNNMFSSAVNIGRDDLDPSRNSPSSFSIPPPSGGLPGRTAKRQRGHSVSNASPEKKSCVISPKSNKSNKPARKTCVRNALKITNFRDINRRNNATTKNYLAEIQDDERERTLNEEEDGDDWEEDQDGDEDDGEHEEKEGGEDEEDDDLGNMAETRATSSQAGDWVRNPLPAKTKTQAGDLLVRLSQIAWEQNFRVLVKLVEDIIEQPPMENILAGPQDLSLQAAVQNCIRIEAASTLLNFHHMMAVIRLACHTDRWVYIHGFQTQHSINTLQILQTPPRQINGRPC